MSPRPGPPRAIVPVRLAQPGIEAIDRIATEQETSRSEVIRQLLSEALAARAKAQR